MTEEPDTVVRGDRFSGGPARGFLSSLAADERIFAADLAVDRAHVAMLAAQGIVDENDASAILSALAEVETAGHAALPEGEDVHEAIETAVVERAGAAGRRMHTARSRNDEVATCIRYRLRSDLLDAAEATIALREALSEQASAHTNTVLPGYTHGQPAQPTAVGHFLSSYESALRRDTARLFDAYDRTNRSPLGAAAFAGTPFDVDRDLTAELLGFDGLIENAMDAVSARDFLLEATSALAMLSTTLSGLATDLIAFTERGFLTLDDDYASTSSIMPQKHNPDTLELVRATAGDAAGAVQGVTTTLSGLPRAYNRDLQRATPHTWAAIDAVTEATRIAAGAVSTAAWNESPAAETAGDGFSTATGVADVLAMAGVPFRTAHEVLATAAQALGPDDQRPTFDDLDAVARDVLGEPLSAVVSREAVEAALDPAENVAMRDSVGGPAPAAVDSALTTAASVLDADRDVLAARRQVLSDAEKRLAEEVAAYV